MEERKPYGVKKEMKKYLNTVEELTQALSEGKTVYCDYDDEGVMEIKLVNGILVQKYEDVFYISPGDLEFDTNEFYLKEKGTLKIEIGKFYKTRSGKKVICVFKDACNKQPFLFSEIGGEHVNSFWTGEEGRYYYQSTTESEEDIVDYWEDK